MKKAAKWALRIGGGLLVLVLIGTVVFWKNIVEISGILKYAAIFKPAHIVENFRTMPEKFPVSTVKKGPGFYELPRKAVCLPETYTTAGEQKYIRDWIKNTGTTGLLVMHDGSIIFEEYYQGTEDTTQLISMSVAKSVFSFLLGVAVDEGLVDLQQPVDIYVPDLKDTGYESITVKNVLQMSSGIHFTEDYGDLNSDIVRMIAAFTTGSISDFVRTLKNGREQGTYLKYVSANSQVLGMVLESVTGKSLAEYTQEKLWTRIGAEQDTTWLVDKEGTALAAGGLCAVLRDFARFGMLYLNMGKNYLGEQLVSEEWIKASVTPDAPHLMPGEGNPASDEPAGYGYHWWIPPEPEGDYLAIGIYGQFIYVNPLRKTVIVKTSAYKDYENTGLAMEYESIDVFQSIARALEKQ